MVGDKSISHRFALLAPFCNGESRAVGFLFSADTLSSLSCMRSLGAKYEITDNTIRTVGGLNVSPTRDYLLDAGNSGTTARLLCGLLCGLGITAKIIGDASLSMRPMRRITDPLCLMGAHIECGDTCPISIYPSVLHGISYALQQNSAQVKSSILFAALSASGTTQITQSAPMRDHSELMLSSMGANIFCDALNTTIDNSSPLCGIDINIPSDISSAAYFIAAASILPNSHIKIKNVGINPTRMGFVAALISMGADISFEHVNMHFEPSADIVVRSSNLHSICVPPEQIPSLIDEIPLLALCACFAQGETRICGVGELRYKESNRLDAIVLQLSKAGGDLIIDGDDIIIRGVCELVGGHFDSLFDHRLAMTFYVASICARSQSTLVGAQCVDISFPDFCNQFKKLEVSL